MSTEKIPCTPAEYDILERSLVSARKQLEYAQKARPGTGIHDAAKHIADRISWLEEHLQIYYPVEGYIHPEGLTVVSVQRGGE